MDIQNEIEKRFLKLNDEEKESLVSKDKRYFLLSNIATVVIFLIFFFLFLIARMRLKDALLASLIFFISVVVFFPLLLLREKKISDEDKKFLFFSRAGAIEIFLFFFVFFILFSIDSKQFEEKRKLCMIFAIAILVIGFAVCVPLFLMEKKISDEKRIKRRLKREIKQENAAQRRKESLFLDENIINVTIIDSYTEVTDKLHALLNYQEVIQTRYYKFKVDYKDGHSKIVTEAEGSIRYKNLIKLLNIGSETEKKQTSDSTEELRKYKMLLDDGIITQEEFEQKKKEILGL